MPQPYSFIMDGAATDMFARSQVATKRPKKHSNEISKRLGQGSDRERPDNPLLTEAEGTNGEGGIELKFKMIKGRQRLPSSCVAHLDRRAKVLRVLCQPRRGAELLIER